MSLQMYLVAYHRESNAELRHVVKAARSAQEAAALVIVNRQSPNSPIKDPIVIESTIAMEGLYPTPVWKVQLFDKGINRAYQEAAFTHTEAIAISIGRFQEEFGRDTPFRVRGVDLVSDTDENQEPV